MEGKRLCALLLLACICIFKQVDCDGVVSLKLVEYMNPAGKLQNGHCCDGKYGICQRKGCDHKFSLCLSSVSREYTCNLASFHTGAIFNKNMNEFGPDIAGQENPMQFSIEGVIPEKFVIKLTVIDEDKHFWTGADDLVDIIQSRANVTDARSAAEARTQIMLARTILTYKVWFSCDPDWYGPRCRIFCPPGSNYICDPVTGDKICNEGFLGDDCETMVNWVSDCDEIVEEGIGDSDGIYNLSLPVVGEFPVYCDVNWLQEGWTVIQRRVNASVDFNRNWTDYVNGFGDVGKSTNYWMGLEKMHQITKQKEFKLLVVFKDDFRFLYEAHYDNFSIGDASSEYTLHLNYSSGNAGDSFMTGPDAPFITHNGQPFSTPDKDNDNLRGENCAEFYSSGWWFNQCFTANLNGVYTAFDRQALTRPCPNNRCIAWQPKFIGYSFPYVEMRILPSD